MVKNYNRLIGIILVCLVGVALLQTYFAYNDFQVKVFQLDKELNEIFTEAIQKEKKMRQDEYVDYFKALLADTNFITIDTRFDEEQQNIVYSVKDSTVKEGYNTSITFAQDSTTIEDLKKMSYQDKIDRLAKASRSQIEEGAIFYWTQIMGELLIDYSKNLVIDTVALDSILGDLMIQNKIVSCWFLVEYIFSSIFYR